MFRVRNIFAINLKVLYFFLALNFSTPFISMAHAQDSGGEEQRLYDIYKDYYSRPTDQELWNRLVTPVVSEVYKIQPGDNLWTISEVFFGDGNYWPKVWSINSKITNPHLIEPGNEIRFQFGTASSQPSFFITEDDSSYTLASDSLVQGSSATADRSGVYIPPPATIFHPVLKTLPPSFPVWQGSAESSTGFDEWGVEIVKRQPLRVEDKTFLQSFVKEGPLEFVGEVIEKLDDSEVIVEGEVIYVKVQRDQARPGQRILLVQDSGKIDLRRAEVKKEDRPDAYVIRVSAEAELTSEVPANEQTRKLDDEFVIYKARLKKSLDLALPGQKILTGRMKSVNHGLKGRMTDQSVTIIGGNLDNNSFQFSTGNFVFLDRGADVGLNIGDIIPIQRTKFRQFREREPLVKFSSVLNGYIQVVDTAGHYSTAIVLPNSEAIRPGDGNRRAASAE